MPSVRWLRGPRIAAGSVLELGLIAPLFARDRTSTVVMLALIVVGVEVVRNIVRREVTPQTGSG
jgi:hypothetical protein